MKAIFVDEFTKLKKIEVDANVKVIVVEWSNNEEQRKFELNQIIHGMKVKTFTGVRNKLRVVNENFLKFYYFKKEFERCEMNFFEEFKDAIYSITQSIMDKKKFDKMILDVYGKLVQH